MSSSFPRPAPALGPFLNSEIPKTTDRETRLPLDTNYVITLTGGRRVGKTYILYNTMSRLVSEGKASKDEIVYVDFEHPRLRNLSAVDLDDILTAFYELTGKKPRYLFLDEIQTVKDYGSWFRRRLDAKVFLTGSSSALTPPRIAEELRGRSLNFEVFPLSFTVLSRGQREHRDRVLHRGEGEDLISVEGVP